MSQSFTWMTDKTPTWFSAENSYRYNPETKQVEVPTESGNTIVDPGDVITLHDDDHLSVFKPGRPQGQAAEPKPAQQRKILSRVFLEFDDGSQAEMKVDAIMIVDRNTKVPLFDEVMESK